MDGGVSIGGGVTNARNVYPKHATHQMFRLGNKARENIAPLELLWWWGKPDNKQGMVLHFYEDNDKGYKNDSVTI